ncbi:MAG: alpha/beta hydrolase [Verrucomicrobia bacterium CG_4_10_14_3_um_filter_43_23]|nr:MAG: alpha/beta hydrolase [Verrucomicrobia bacterium CG22_combo_CG10-13_8_21_14_all_43_17]PIX58171.1 MAG: alpha/beta hydrolase [Verrucomicrobia bacterium CG_4_10_14_3_um_filter_43_23]PJA43378.1 MAG: alpha/beta hydrolase [Verrucomicrobia bacterium CG_4_9_14_3_um_filter_43_20]
MGGLGKILPALILTEHHVIKSTMLADRSFGTQGKPYLIILHGLLGSSRNWASVGKLLAEHFDVYALDLINHGVSPHRDSMTFDNMVEDLHEWISAHAVSKHFFLLGHSLGGKVAMAYAMKYPQKIRGLIIEDIAPKEYHIHFADYLLAMLSIDLTHLKSRHEAEKAIETTVPDWAMRQFLLTNLAREGDSWKWNPNLQGLLANLAPLMKSPIKENEVFHGHAFFIRGESSGYVLDEDKEAIKKHFPRSALMTFKDGGHNLHIETPEKFARAISRYKEFVSTHPPFAITREAE